MSVQVTNWARSRLLFTSDYICLTKLDFQMGRLARPLVGLKCSPHPPLFYFFPNLIIRVFLDLHFDGSRNIDRIGFVIALSIMYYLKVEFFF